MSGHTKWALIKNRRAQALWCHACGSQFDNPAVHPPEPGDPYIDPATYLCPTCGNAKLQPATNRVNWDLLVEPALAALKAQNEAIDRLFASLIERSMKEHSDEVFYPSKSGQPWDALVEGQKVIAMLEEWKEQQFG